MAVGISVCRSRIPAIPHTCSKSLRGLQERFKNRFGFKLFRPLGEDDTYKEDGIMVPSNDSIAEFDRQIIYLANLLPESIDKKQLLKYVGGSVENCGSIKILEAFLNRLSLPTDIIPLLQRIQDFRSSGAVHRKGRQYAKNVEKYSLNKIGRKEFIRKLLADMIKTFDNLP